MKEKNKAIYFKITEDDWIKLKHKLLEDKQDQQEWGERKVKQYIKESD